tara:strand:+ start:4412 stop:4912 length:501 start_codon:yes stop_codon:yes gene_type:complete
MTCAYIALGSNLGEPLQQLRRATSAIAELPESELARVSSVYRSAPVGPPGQPDYLNAVLCLKTQLDPHALLDALQLIELRQGRERLEHWGPRTLDLDLLLYGTTIISDERLTLPHPRMHERDFVLLPLQEISDAGMTLPDGSDLQVLVRNCPANNLNRIDCTLNTP